MIAGYLLGALPLASYVSRRNGVDIFSAGSGLPGASNVLHSVGKVPAALVFIGDVGKGALAVLVAEFLGVDGPWLLLPAFAAVAGHWNPVFTGFRGGDSLAVVGGVVIALFPVFGTISVAVAFLVAWGGQRMPYTSLLSIVFGYTTLVALSIAYDGDTILALGYGGLAGLVLAHALLGHRRRRHETEWEDLEEAGGATERSGSQ